MSKKRGLGKGLESLLGSEAVADSHVTSQTTSSQLVALNKLRPNPFQPRKVFDEMAIQALSDSIRQHGVIQPLAVRSITNGEYEIIAGERRFRAAKLAGLTEVPVVIHDVSDNDSAIFALIENIQREDLNVIEKARGIQSLIENFHLTHEACGQVLGQSRSAISNTLRLLDLSEVVQAAVVDKHIDMGHARALLGVEKAEQNELLQTIRLNGLSVRETEALVRDSQPQKIATKKAQKSAEMKQLETRLSESLQTKVNISQQTAGHGKITVSFSDQAMLNKLIQRMGLG